MRERGRTGVGMCEVRVGDVGFREPAMRPKGERPRGTRYGAGAKRHK